MTRHPAHLLFGIALILVHEIALASDAKELLAGMADKLSGTDQFGVVMTIRYDSVQASGRSVEFSERRTLIIDRPRKMRVDVIQSDGDSGGLVLDGSVITQFNLGESVYSQLQQPGDLDEAIRYAVSKLGVRFPLARLMMSDLKAELAGSIERVAFVETDQLGKQPLEHIAAIGSNVDAQFWIRPDGLPARIVLDYRNAPGQPRFSADFTDWNLKPPIDEDTFQFKVPAGAEKIPVILRATPMVEEDSQ